jgi:predicted phosphodiesterase
MKYAIISDIHANLQALNAVLEDSKVQGCTHYACLGDTVGYGGRPKECLEIIRDMGMPCVKGNFDEYCSSGEKPDGFNPLAAKSVEWTRSKLSAEERAWMSSLPLVALVDGFTMVHATLDGPQRWGYAFNKLDAAASFPYLETTVCFFGHTHVPLVFMRETSASGQPVVKGGTCTKFNIERNKKYFVNPGSVGQPRDNNPKAAYATYDMDQQAIEVRRLEYDIASAQSDIPPENRKLN